MLKSRIIPCLLIQKGGLVKTTNFKDPKYVGDPINAVKIFNEKEVDELIVLDIDATAEGREPDYVMIKNLAAECRMPFCYGGGIKTVEQAKRIIGLGAEKVALSSAALNTPQVLAEIGKAVGVQSVVVVIDVKKSVNFSVEEYDIYLKNGKEKSSLGLKEFVNYLNVLGIGELVINSIDRDGRMKGYDLELLEFVRGITDFPITSLGGAGHLNDIKEVISKFHIIGAAAGSLFVFKGKYRAVLINYPNAAEKKELYS